MHGKLIQIGARSQFYIRFAFSNSCSRYLILKVKELVRKLKTIKSISSHLMGFSVNS